MKARELDSIIQVKVFGWAILQGTIDKIMDAHFRAPDSHLWREMKEIPNYSTDMNEAMKLIEGFPFFQIERLELDQRLRCILKDSSGRVETGFGPTPASAVCIAVLQYHGMKKTFETKERIEKALGSEIQLDMRELKNDFEILSIEDLLGGI